MTDNVPVSREDGPGTRAAAQGTDAVSGAAARQIDPAALGAAFPRTHHILQLEFGDRRDFDDPRREWRRLFSELLGTFALVLVAAGGGLLHAKGQISLAAAVVAPGLMVMAIILFMGAVSGAHLNPAVSLAFALRGDFPWKRVPGYIVIQLIGATLAALFLRWVFGNVEHLGATLPGPGYHNWQALLMEIVLTALLVSVILGTASAAQNVGAIAALGVGGYIALAGLWAAPVSGVSMNPARSFGPALASGYWTSYWVYLVGPVAGALIAVGFAFVLRGRGGDVIARAAGSGVLDQGALAAKARTVRGHRPGQGRPPGHRRHRDTVERARRARRPPATTPHHQVTRRSDLVRFDAAGKSRRAIRLPSRMPAEDQRVLVCAPELMTAEEPTAAQIGSARCLAEDPLRSVTWPRANPGCSIWMPSRLVAARRRRQGRSPASPRARAASGGRGANRPGESADTSRRGCAGVCPLPTRIVLS